MKPSTISRAAFNRAVRAACASVAPNPPFWFRHRNEPKIKAALLALNITVTKPRGARK